MVPLPSLQKAVKGLLVKDVLEVAERLQNSVSEGYGFGVFGECLG
jgi:hypothetical protein